MPSIIRTSDRLQFKRCRRAWDLGSKIRQNYEPIVSPYYFDFGTAIHAALESFYHPNTWEHFTVEELRVVAQGTFHAVWNERRKTLAAASLDGVSVDDTLMEEWEEYLVLGAGMINHYIEVYGESDRTFWTPRMAEIEFEVPIEMPDDFGEVVYQGRCDLLAEDRQGHLWIWDHKTAGQFGSTDYLDMDEQCGSYIWALRKKLGVDIEGVVYNRLLKAVPKPPEPLKKGGFSKNKQQRTTYELYTKTLQQHGISPAGYQEFLDYLKDQDNPFFQRIAVSRSGREIELLGHQITVEAIDMLNRPSIYPAPGLFNCMGCSFRTPCLAMNDGSDYQWILDSQFKLRTADDPTGSTNE